MVPDCATEPAVGVGVRPEQLEPEIVRLYEACYAGLLRYAMTIAADRHLAEDAIQECFLELFVAWQNRQPIASPKAWLYRVLRNRLLNHARRAALSPVVASEAVRDFADHRADPEACCWHEEVCRGLRAVLSAREMECLHLRLEGLAYREIGAILGVQTGTVSATLANAVRKARRALLGREEGACVPAFGV
jgi:RNA polymerase sigma-70 factor (ECF subfamily)